MVGERTGGRAVALTRNEDIYFGLGNIQNDLSGQIIKRPSPDFNLIAELRRSHLSMEFPLIFLVELTVTVGVHCVQRQRWRCTDNSVLGF